MSTAGGNDAFGYEALWSNTTGLHNTAMGQLALFNNADGNDNVALGNSAGINQDIGSGNVYIGSGIGGVAGESNHTYIRNIASTNVSGGGTDTVTIDLTTGLIGHLTSSRRYKDEIKPMNAASETLYRLKPVTFRYKKEIDAGQTLDYGLVAEDVAEVDPDLAVRDKNGQIESVRYTAVNAMLLNEFLKEHRKVDEQARKIREQETMITQLRNDMETVVARLKQHDSKIERVSDQPQRSRPEPKLVQNR